MRWEVLVPVLSFECPSCTLARRHTNMHTHVYTCIHNLTLLGRRGSAPMLGTECHVEYIMELEPQNFPPPRNFTLEYLYSATHATAPSVTTSPQKPRNAPQSASCNGDEHQTVEESDERKRPAGPTAEESFGEKGDGGATEHVEEDAEDLARLKEIASGRTLGPSRVGSSRDGEPHSSGVQGLMSPPEVKWSRKGSFHFLTPRSRNQELRTDQEFRLWKYLEQLLKTGTNMFGASNSSGRSPSSASSSSIGSVSPSWSTSSITSPSHLSTNPASPAPLPKTPVPVLLPENSYSSLLPSPTLSESTFVHTQPPALATPARAVTSSVSAEDAVPENFCKSETITAEVQPENSFPALICHGMMSAAHPNIRTQPLALSFPISSYSKPDHPVTVPRSR